jgi:hypothetical protein
MRALLALSLTFVLALAFGCASKPATTVTAPSTDQVSGPAARFFPRSIGDTESAANDALKSMNLVIVARDDSPTGRIVEARRADNSPVFVDLARLEKGTEVRVRFGLYGDEPTSLTLLDAMAARLK